MDDLIEHFWIFGVGLAGFLALYPVSLMRRDASVVDFWWGPGFGAMALALWVSLGQPGDAAVLLVLIPLLLWSGRLGLHLGWRRVTEGHEDPRYTELREAWSPGWAWKSFFIVFLLQSVLQALIAAPVLTGLAAASGAQVSITLYALAFVAVSAIVIEAVADIQLDRYRSAARAGSFLSSGLRGIVRHPNYSAEILFWAAMGGMALSLGIWWAALSPALVWLLLRHVSGVTIIEERMSQSRPGYAEYRDRVPALLPDIRRLLRDRRGLPVRDKGA